MPHLISDNIDEPGLNTLAVYEQRGGYEQLRKAVQFPPEAIVEEITRSGIRGRGGAGFKMGMKVSLLGKGEVTYLVCNADESEPGTFKDRDLLMKTPHALIEGIVLSCFGVGIHQAFIFIRGEYELPAEILEAAVAEAYEAGFLGENILGTGFDLELVVHRGAGAYICGEETGLLDALEGRRGNPRLKPPFPAVKGLYQEATLINNVETLATVPQIMRIGGEAYAQLGTETSTGTKMISVSGDVERPGVFEVELGKVTGRDIIYELCGGMKAGRELLMWFPGGSSSPVLTSEDLDLPYDFDTMQKAGSMLGSGAVIVLDDSHTPLEVAQKLSKFYSHESCGKCVPCREGTAWVHKILARMASGEATPMDLDLIASLAPRIMGHCLCVLGDALMMPVGSIVQKFRPQLEQEILNARSAAHNADAEHAIPIGAGLAGAY